MTNLYFIRHAEPRYDSDDRTRGLSEKGLSDRRLVTAFLADKSIDTVLSSPFKRAADTVREFADAHGLDVVPVEDFRERRIAGTWIGDFRGLGYCPLLVFGGGPENCHGAWVCQLACSGVTMSIHWGSRSSGSQLICHLGPFWF